VVAPRLSFLFPILVCPYACPFHNNNWATKQATTKTTTAADGKQASNAAGKRERHLYIFIHCSSSNTFED